MIDTRYIYISNLFLGSFVKPAEEQDKKETERTKYAQRIVAAKDPEDGYLPCSSK